MKILIAILLFSSAAFSAVPTTFFCGGQNADRENIQIVVNLSAKTIDMNLQDMGPSKMPPYSYTNIQSWRLIDATMKLDKITAEGRTTGFTTGRAGRISLSAIRPHSATVQVFNGIASITAPMRVLRPTIAERISVSCRVK